MEYVYRNVFVTEILDSKRKRKCRLSKDSDDSDKAGKSVDTPSKEAMQEKESKDIKKEIVKESPSVETKKKKGDLKLKITDKGIKGKVCDISSDTALSPPPAPTSDKKKRKSIDKEKDTPVTDIKKSQKGSDPRKSSEFEEPKRKRVSGDKHELKKCIDAKRLSIEQLYLGTDCEKIKSSSLFDDDFASFRSDDRDEFSQHIIPRSEEKKKVKFAEKEEIKLFERDEPEVVPTLAESVKSRRKEREKKHQGLTLFCYFVLLKIDLRIVYKL